MPDGWFCVLRSHELEKGQVESVKFCEGDVAALELNLEKLESWMHIVDIQV